MRLLRHSAFLAACLSHFSVDVLNGQVGVLLAALSLSLGLSNAQIGLIATAYSMVGSLSQPLFGWLADKDGGRWTAAGGVLWMAAFFVPVALAPAPWAIAFLVIASLGSAAFHPPGTAKAAQVGAWGMAGQAATAASIFFLFGQVGLSVGPAIAGLIMDHAGRTGILGLAVLVLPLGAFTLWAMRAAAAPSIRSQADRAGTPAPQLWFFLLILLVSGLRVWAQSAITTFSPKFFQDQGLSPSAYGLIVALFMGGTAVGGVLGSTLADRWSYKRTVTVSFVASIIPFFLFPLAPGAWAYGIAVLAGLCNGGPHSILVTMAQRALPGRASFASGVILGVQFALGSLGTYFTGWLADQTTLTLALQMNAVLALTAALGSLGLLLEGRPVKTAPASTGD